VTAGAILILGGVAGKSAQVPLQTWLPDAMAGPTPVSALIHAATMVAAGAYVVARLYPVYLASTAALVVLAVVAAVTMVFSAVAAFAQDDLKRVLAWSTVSQLAYMTGGLAVGGRDAAVFHLLTHGVFKALLFLAAGVVIHLAGSGRISDMGGLRRKSPLVFATATLGLAALAGVPPLSGFFSKEAVIGAAEHTALHAPAGGPPAAAGWLVLASALLTAVLTAAYAMRLWLRVFFGENRTVHGEVAGAPDVFPSGSAAAVAPGIPAGAPAGAPSGASADAGLGAPADAEVPERAAEKPVRHDAVPAAMRWPLALLAVPTVLLGVIGLSTDWLPTWLGDADGRPYTTASADAGRLVENPAYYDLVPGAVTSVVAVALLALGAFAVLAAWRRDPAADPARLLGPLRGPAERGFDADRFQDAAVVRPVTALARAVRKLDTAAVGGAVRGAADGVWRTGGFLRRSQNGNVQVYLAGLLTGIVVLAVAVAVNV
jgi:NADH-quinone oxidoreductase subunit L